MPGIPARKKTEDVHVGAKGGFRIKNDALRPMLAIPTNQDISAARLKKAEHSGDKLEWERAGCAEGFKKMRKR